MFCLIVLFHIAINIRPFYSSDRQTAYYIRLYMTIQCSEQLRKKAKGLGYKINTSVIKT